MHLLFSFLAGWAFATDHWWFFGLFVFCTLWATYLHGNAVIKAVKCGRL
jgi:hypothetical protein